MLDRCSPSAVRSILQRYGLHPKKRLGQNFLVDRNVLTRIATAADLTPGQYVVEIGPGLGGLTQELAQRAQGVLAVEIDTSLAPVLHELAGQLDNVRLLFGDILAVDIEAELAKAFDLEEPPPYQVCANIPYNITSPIIFMLLQRCPALQSATLMVQKEVGERLLARPGSKDYGRLTVTASYRAQVELVMAVSRNCFYPRPEVDSIVVSLRPRRFAGIEPGQEQVLLDFIRSAFQKRRKTILNIASQFFGRDKPSTTEALERLGLSPLLRPENLSLEDFARLVETLACPGA
jgi:16S rRNA (adenine1518-N6/adenine1519-N6)-dimethyltransferase